MPLDHVQIGLCDRVLCHKNRAAVLVGKNRSLIRADFLRNIHDLHLVKADQRPKYRHRTHLVCHRQGLNGLGSHLTDALPRDQAHTLRILSQPLGNPHHIPPHNDRQLFMRTLLVNVHLNICKINNMEVDGTGIPGDDPCQVHHLLFGPVTGVGRGMEIDRIDFYPSFGYHIARHRGIDPPR